MQSTQAAWCRSGIDRLVRVAHGIVLLAALAILAGCTSDGSRSSSHIVDPEFAKQVPADSLAPLYAMDDPDRIPGRYIVRFKPNVADVRGLTKALEASHNGRVYEVLEGLKGFWGELPDQAIQGLRRNSNIAYIEADVAMPVVGVGDTTQMTSNWRLDRVDQRSLPLDGKYEYSSKGTGVRIWIIDSGVDRNEPDLAGRIDESWYVTYNGKDPYAPCNSHGTMVAIVAAGTVNGVAKGATIHSARVDADCDGHLSTGAASTAFEFIADYSPRPAVINFSAGKECGFFGCGPTVDDAAKYARSKGVTVVVAAGNDGRDACDYAPAHVGELLTVGASNNYDERFSYSNWGSCVDLFAPSTSTGGTSAAAPMVTGAAALYLQLYPGASPSAVDAEIKSKATQGRLSNIGSGSPNRLLYTKQPALSVRIDGPTTLGPYTRCTWYATISGGQPPYQYQWTRDGAVVSTSSSYTVAQGGHTDFVLDVRVTDGVGRVSGNNAWISIDPHNHQLMCEL